MLDIMTHIRNREALQADPEGHLLALDPWSEALAQDRARAQGIALSVDHWEVIYYLRHHYRDFGPPANARALLHDLQDRFSAAGGKRYLFRLFPHGPIAQGCRIAGLPMPAHTTDPSSGNVH